MTNTRLVALPLPCVLSVAILVITPTANAQETADLNAGDDADRAMNEARTRFEEGVALASQNRWERALQAFDSSFATWPTPVALFNRCLCLRRLEQVPAALGCYERYLLRYGSETSAEDRAEARDEIRRLGAQAGAMTIEVEGPETASLMLDGSESGELPREGRIFIEPGRHAIEVRAQGYVPTRREIDIEAGAELTMLISMVPVRAGIGTILVETELHGVVVTVDGDEIGTTPLLDQAIVMAAGEHVVEGRRSGYSTGRVDVSVNPGQASRVVLELSPLDQIPTENAGELNIAISEEAAQVLVDGQPLEGVIVPVGRHRVDVQLEGFRDWSQQIDVEPGSVTSLDVSLVPTDTFLESYRSRARGYRIGAWATMGTGAATLGTALGLLIWNLGRRDDWSAENDALDGYTGADRVRRIEENQDLGDSISTVAGVNWALLGIGSAAAVASVLLFVIGPRPGRYETLSLTPHPGGLSARLSW